MRLLPALTAVLLCAAPAAAQPDTQDELEALEKKLVAAHAAARAAVGAVVVSRSDQYPKPAAPPAHPGQLGGFDRKASLKADPSPARAELAARLDLADPRAVADHGAAGGVVIDPAGLVLTNYHTIDGATKIYVHLPAGGSYADIHAADGRSDLAVLKLQTPPAGLKALPFADVRLPGGRADEFPNLVPGRLLLAAGPPVPGGGKAAGGLAVVAGVHRPRPEANFDAARSVYQYGPVLELDARADPGCSGAALLTLDGKLAGLTTTVAAAGDPARALPFDANLRRVVDALRRGEEVEYGFLGVLPQSAQEGGVLAMEVTHLSPAAAAGLRRGDRIVRINGYPANVYEDLLQYVGTALAGNTIDLEVRRGGESLTLPVRVAKYRNEVPWLASVRPEPVLGLRVEYTSVLALGRRDAGVPAGVLVREVVPGGPAAAKFKALGEGRWAVKEVNGNPVNTPAEFRDAAGKLKSAKLTVYDPTDPNGRRREVTIP
ncbi:MAG: PDZ domain-containing protein [Gemmataceae bacterium]|nr:PDZ domain-containing protein [Gemmataceae bacterium]